MGAETFTLIVPCYNYKTKIQHTIERLEQWRDEKAPGLRLFLVDDGSLDGTGADISAFASSHAAWCQAVLLSKNQGKGAALRAGFAASRGGADKIVFTDCDLHYGLDVITDKVLPALAEADVVILDRSWNGTSHPSVLRQITSYVFNRAVSIFTGVNFRDTQAGLKGFRAAACGPLFEKTTIAGFAFDVEILSLACYYRLRVAQVPVRFRPGTAFSSLSTVRMVRSSLGMLWAVLKIDLNWKLGRYDVPALAGRIDRDAYEIADVPSHVAR